MGSIPISPKSAMGNEICGLSAVSGADGANSRSLFSIGVDLYGRKFHGEGEVTTVYSRTWIVLVATDTSPRGTGILS